MMSKRKTGIVAALFGLVLFGSGAAALAGTVEVSFDYQKQRGFASNQFAVWVEDSSGRMIKTLFVTDFTAGRNGWNLRKQSIPDWVRVSGIATMNKAEIDAVSMATPASGKQTLVWNGEDASGKPVPNGDYVVYVEGSLRGEDRVLYKTTVAMGGKADETRPEPEYTGHSAAERAMIGDVTVRYIP